MNITTNGKRVEVYGVTVDMHLEKSTLKAEGFKWFPPKRCWTKYGGDENKIRVSLGETGWDKDTYSFCSVIEQIRELEKKIADTTNDERVDPLDAVSCNVKRLQTMFQEVAERAKAGEDFHWTDTVEEIRNKYEIIEKA